MHAFEGSSLHPLAREKPGGRGGAVAVYIIGED
jgi:hypothetical protein